MILVSSGNMLVIIKQDLSLWNLPSRAQQGYYVSHSLLVIVSQLEDFLTLRSNYIPITRAVFGEEKLKLKITSTQTKITSRVIIWPIVFTDMKSSKIDYLRNLSNCKRLILRFFNALIFHDKCSIYITQCQAKLGGHSPPLKYIPLLICVRVSAVHTRM